MEGRFRWSYLTSGMWETNQKNLPPQEKSRKRALKRNRDKQGKAGKGKPNQTKPNQSKTVQCKLTCKAPQCWGKATQERSDVVQQGRDNQAALPLPTHPVDR